MNSSIDHNTRMALHNYNTTQPAWAILARELLWHATFGTWFDSSILWKYYGVNSKLLCIECIKYQLPLYTRWLFHPTTIPTQGPVGLYVQHLNTPYGPVFKILLNFLSVLCYSIFSTTENLAVFIWDGLKSALSHSSATLFEVLIHETEKNTFFYRGE